MKQGLKIPRSYNHAKEARVIGDDSFVVNAGMELYVAVAVGNTEKRKQLCEKYRTNLIAPSVVMSRSVQMGIGNIICAGCIITMEIEIGDFNIINLDCTVGHEVCIGSYVTLNPSVNVSGNVHLGNGSNIGTGEHIIQGIEIEDNVIVGAGTVVIRNVLHGNTVVGYPARIIKGK